MRGLWLGFVLACGVALAASAEVAPLDFAQTLETEQVHLGEPFSVEMRIRHRPDHRFDLGTSPAMGDFEVLSLTRERQDTPGEAVTTFRLTLSAFALGTLALPERRFEVTTPEGKGSWVAPPLSVSVVESIDVGADGGVTFRDYKPPEEVRVRSWALLLWLAGAVALGVALFFLIRALSARRGRAAPAPPPAPLDLRTLDALMALRREQLPEQGRAREFYFRLSELLRGYLGERYHFEALECTSAELIERLGRLSEPNLARDALIEFIRRSDVIKFARGEASVEDCEKDLGFAASLVRATTPPPAVTDVR